MDFQPQIDRILEKLKRARSSGKQCFGAEKHDFLLKSTLSDRAIQLFEERHSIVLPEDYRQFLTRAGSSGAGPYWGLMPLDDWDYATGSVKGSLPSDFLARPCPLVPGTQPLLPEVDIEDSGFDPGDELIQGAITIVDEGCCSYCLLIVSGSVRGRVVYISWEAQGTDRDLVLFPENLNFISWYEQWLDSDDYYWSPFRKIPFRPPWAQ